ncbi:hypothetical protein AAF712_013863 [Marasmius tenuissimus]|uniref:Uncharacterized protein n=1 Tax=Marasmius tenuissimus TaxID=585030 RepID=A0ABR2ZCJ4_9AGAR
MARTVEQIVAPYTTVQTGVVQTVTTLSVLFLIYGIYIMLFGLAMRILLRRGTPSSGLYLGFTVSLFVLATVDNLFIVWGLIQDSTIIFNAIKTRNYSRLLNHLRHDRVKTALFTAENLGITAMKYVS